jgi:1,4-alpha-glucan branching enzyme
MLTKHPLKSGKVEVTFAMPPLENVSKLYLVGDFNNWSIAAHPLARARDGAWSLTLELEAGRSYQFRYFGDDAQWYNDWQADAYAPNEFGSDNSVVIVSAANGSAEAKPAKKRVPRAKKAAEGGETPAPKKRATRKKTTA